MLDKFNMFIIKFIKIFFNEINEIKWVREKYCYYFLEFVFVNDFVVFIYIIFYFVVYESLRNICVVCVVKFF